MLLMEIRHSTIYFLRGTSSIYRLYSQSEMSTDPVVLWLNGGPGCSSMIGFVSENGPFVFKPQSKEMMINPYSWNKNAHVIYL